MNKKNKDRVLALKKDMAKIFYAINYEDCEICLLRDECRLKSAQLSSTKKTTEILNITKSCPFVATWIERILFPNQFNYVMEDKFMTVFEGTTDDFVILTKQITLLTLDGKIIHPAWNTRYTLIPPSFREFFTTTIMHVLPELESKIKHWPIAKRKTYFEKYIKSKKNG